MNVEFNVNHRHFSWNKTHMYWYHEGVKCWIMICTVILSLALCIRFVKKKNWLDMQI